ncbi:efflux RND transporter periplasmic adaptor subunit [Rhodohalobacter sp. 8-1]|uniref:efflux RND transporter periplasmic adaptor subunit n=1 Tax=Rhodohalobacter sp. 8-1 TaxID=3131972 RepID=UPI0030EDCF7A
MNIIKTQLLKAAGLLIGGLFLGWLIFGGTTSITSHADHDQLTPEEMDQHVTEEHTDEEGNIVYTCSMHPSVRENEPGNCPICGMDLIPVSNTEEQPETDDYSMIMTQASMQLANIQTTPVIREIPTKVLDLPGRITVDERRITNITTHFAGRILNTRVNFTGAQIRKGQPMATIYSPDLISAQRELIEAEKQKERNPRLYESARQKFRLWEFTHEQIDKIIEQGEVQRELEILSPVDGFVLSRNIADQQYVSVGTIIFEVADLSNLWVMLEAYEEDLGWISIGDSLQFSGRNNPVEILKTTVSFIDPVVDPQKRTVGVRAEIQNSGNRLKPDMLVRGRLTSEMNEQKLMVPASAVLWTGPRSLVYVKDNSADIPRFEVKEVELGPRTGDYFVIEDGLEHGEEVVFNGAFRIDSEMQLADRFSMMNREPGNGAGRGVHDHGGMEMNMDNTGTEQADTVSADDHSGHQIQEDLEVLIPEYLELRDALSRDDFDSAREQIAMFTDNEFSDIEELRAAFKTLSEMLITRVEEEGYDGDLFKQYCPMYDGGSAWISNKEEIENPFYGSQMHNCGEIVEKIE